MRGHKNGIGVEIHFLVDCGNCKPVFATMAEANAFANEVMRKTGEVLEVRETYKKVRNEWRESV